MGENLNVIVWLLTEVNARMRQKRESVAIYSQRDYRNSCVSSSSKIQALVDQLQRAEKFFLATKYGLFVVDESCFEGR